MSLLDQLLPSTKLGRVPSPSKRCPRGACTSDAGASSCRYRDAMLNELEFKSSSYCQIDTCVEVAVAAGNVRFLKIGDVIPVPITPDEWRDFIAGVKDGEFD